MHISVNHFIQVASFIQPITSPLSGMHPYNSCLRLFSQGILVDPAISKHITAFKPSILFRAHCIQQGLCERAIGFLLDLLTNRKCQLRKCLFYLCTYILRYWVVDVEDSSTKRTEVVNFVAVIAVPLKHN